MAMTELSAIDFCQRCVSDHQADPDFTLNELGVCRYCELHDALTLQRRGLPCAQTVLANIREDCQSLKYDCLIGISGGVDSSYVTHLALEHKLRPLVVHFDNGWNSELAVDNIKRILTKTGFDLHTLVVDWKEFADIQKAFFRASVVDIEIVTDHAITATMMNLAREYDIPYVLSGSNQATECGMPESWSWRKQDWINIRGVHKRFGALPLKTFPRYGTVKMLYDRHFGSSLKSIPILDHLPYRKDHAIQTLSNAYGWRAYGGKHYESLFTKFYQAHVLPNKFGIDKRKSHLSSLIRNGEISRDYAQTELAKPLYLPHELAVEKDYVLKKLEFTPEEFDSIMQQAPKLHTDYPSDQFILDFLHTLNRLGLKRMLVRNSRL